MRLNRGIIILGIVATLVTIANVYYSLILDALLCFDSCTDVGGMLANGQWSSLLLPLLILFPSAILIVVAWAWEINVARRLGARRLLGAVITFPAVSLVAGLAVMLLTRITAQGVVMYPINIGYGSFALALWPLLITLTAAFWRGAATAPAVTSGAAG